MDKKMKELYKHTRKDHDIKQLGKRFSELNTKFELIMHYWKVRCNERKALHLRKLEVERILERAKKLENLLSKSLGKKYITIRARENLSPENKLCYPLFMNHNDANRLKHFLDRNLHDRYVKKIPGRMIMQLTKREYSKLKWMLREKETHQ